MSFSALGSQLSRIQKILNPEQIESIIKDPDNLAKIIKQEVKKETLHLKNIYKA